MASNQSAYAPARPDGETAPEWDEFPQSALDTPDLPRFPHSPEAAAYTAALRGMESHADSLPRQRHLAPEPALAAAPAAVTTAPDAPAFDFFADDLPAYGFSGARPDVKETGAPDTTTAGPATDGRLAGPVDGPPPLATDTARTTDHTAPHDPGEALCARILGQVTARREAAARAEREAAEREAAREAAARKVREQAAAAKAAAEARAKADAEAAARAEAERIALLARSYITPLASYTLTAGFGEADPWANLHTGQDFNAPTGTPVHAIHTGTVSSAGWAGAYGYRVVLRLDDGTELWYCHLSTMVVTAGQVTTGDTIGRVGATGNVPAPHLHLEVRPGGGEPVDPLPWLRTHDVAV